MPDISHITPLPLRVSPSKKLSLNVVFSTLGYDSFLKKAASRVLRFEQKVFLIPRQALLIRSQDFLMRAWLAGIVLAIFGLWLAVI